MNFFRPNFFLIIIASFIISVAGNGCAQIGTPTGGIKDSLPPVLVKASPAERTTNFRGNKISLVFNEYVELKDVPSNVFISPVQKNNPVISQQLRTINIKFRDSLLPNTTYSINFGNAIQDINENNILKNYSYIFSTGNTIDSLSWSGKVLMAETGLADSNLIAMLYKNADDSAVQKRKPDYIARLKGDGSFTFKNLPPANFKVYALKDGDNGKTYNSKTEAFAFADKEIKIDSNTAALTLYAYIQEKAAAPRTTTLTTASADKRLRYSSSIADKTQDILKPLEISFNRALKNYDAAKILITDTLFKPLPKQTISIDSNRKILTIAIPWIAASKYILLLPKDAVTDTTGAMLTRSDTIRFSAKMGTDYGSILLRFKNLDISLHPVIQFLAGENIKFSYPITGSSWSQKLFTPGDYEIRILYDSNQNGKWDAGNYSKKLQPEKSITLPQKITIRADWENERDIDINL